MMKRLDSQQGEWKHEPKLEDEEESKWGVNEHDIKGPCRGWLVIDKKYNVGIEERKEEKSLEHRRYKELLEYL